MMREYVKTVDGLNVYFDAIEEYVSPQEAFSYKQTGVNHSKLIQRILNGEEEYFCAKVSAVSPETGQEVAVDYLGSCVYTPARSFIKDSGYFDDMVNNVISEAREKMKAKDCDQGADNDQKCQ